MAGLREEYERDIDVVHLAAELVVDALVEPEDLRAEMPPDSAPPSARTGRSPAAATGSTPV